MPENIPVADEWPENIPAIQVSDRLLGDLPEAAAVTGPLNLGRQALANRTAFLRAAISAYTAFDGAVIAPGRFVWSSDGALMQNATAADIAITGRDQATLVGDGLVEYFLTLQNDTVAIAAPAGAVLPFAFSTPPVGWLECDGSAISRASYAALFGQIGTAYGPGDGVNTFGVPDLRGEFLRGWDHGRGIDTARGIGTAQPASRLHVQGTGSREDTTQFDTVSKKYRLGNIFVLDAHLEDIKTLNYNAVSGTYFYVPVSTVAAPTGDEAIHAATRPRNVAMMYCIKY